MGRAKGREGQREEGRQLHRRFSSAAKSTATFSRPVQYVSIGLFLVSGRFHQYGNPSLKDGLRSQECFRQNAVETRSPVFFPSFTRLTLIECAGALGLGWSAAHRRPIGPPWPASTGALCHPRSAHLKCPLPQIRMRSGIQPRRPLTGSGPPDQSARALYPCQTSISPLRARLFMRRWVCRVDAAPRGQWDCPRGRRGHLSSLLLVGFFCWPFSGVSCLNHPYR